MSLTDNYNVHLGFWTNWSKGKVEGATLTLTKKDGGLLIAFIAIFIGASGKSFWRLACFLLHRMISSPRPQGGIYHQIQAILRNSDTAQDTAWSLGQVVWAWRVPVRFRQPFPRLFGIIALALLVSTSFGVAGVFSSHITTDTANEVLLTGDNCGPLKGDDGVHWDDYVNLFEPLQWKRITAYENYALQCYGGNMSAGAEDCSPYVQSSLKTTITRNASCPFSKEMCKSQTDNLIVDTGFLDSNEDLGINSAQKERFELRLVHHCAPLVTQGFSEQVKDDVTNETAVRYYYGALSGGLNYTQAMPLVNATDAQFTQANYSTLKPWRTQPRADYGVNVVKSYAGSETIQLHSTYSPIPQLKRNDADVMLFFLSSPNIQFISPVDDPWFSAHRPGPPQGDLLINGTRPTYLQDEPVGVMGCAMQIQFCNPNNKTGTNSGCWPLTGFVDDRFDVTDIYNTPSLQKRFKWIVDAFQLGFFSISGVVDDLGVSALLARQGLAKNTQGPLPSNQWQLEVEHWVGASLTSIQGTLVEMGNGPPTEVYDRFRKVPNSTEQIQACRSIKIMTTKYSSFSVLGVCLILLLGGIIMLLDLALEPLLEYMHHRQAKGKSRLNGKAAYSRLEWNATTTLQLQRLAHEHIGAGTWKTAAWGHPITSHGDKLAMISTEDQKYIRPDQWEDIEKAHASDPRIDPVMRRSATFETFSSDTTMESEKKVRRVDTTATLVGQEDLEKTGSKECCSPAARDLDARDGHEDAISPIERRTCIHEHVDSNDKSVEVGLIDGCEGRLRDG